MSKNIASIQEALEILKPNILAHLAVYHVNKPDESSVLPQALWTSPDELRALALVIESASQFQEATGIIRKMGEQAKEKLDDLASGSPKREGFRWVLDNVNALLRKFNLNPVPVLVMRKHDFGA